MGAIPARLVGGDEPWVNKRELGKGSALVDGGTGDPSWNATSPRLPPSLFPFTSYHAILCMIPAISPPKHTSCLSTCDFLGVTLLRKGFRVCSSAICTCVLRALRFLPCRVGDWSRSVSAEGIIPLATKNVSCACPRGHGICGTSGTAHNHMEEEDMWM